VDSERATRLVSDLRARRVMAHVAETGVYQFGIRVVIDNNIEALWDTDGAPGLDAEVLSDGVLVGFVPHIAGSEDFTDQQLVDAIAATRYSTEGLGSPSGGEPAHQAQDGPAAVPLASASPASPARRPSGPARHAAPKRARLGRWWHR
jgi:hypothetical protein